MRRFLMVIVGLIASAVGQANAGIVYMATRAVGSGTESLSISTDGTLGILGTSNIIGWTIAMTDGSDSFTLKGPTTGSNSTVTVVGTALTATATDLLFNYNAGATQFILIQSPSLGSGKLFWAVQTNGAFDFSGPAEAIDPRSDFTFLRSPRSGNLVIASVAPAVTAVPEPSTVISAGIAGLMTLGYGLRRRKLAVA